MANEYDYLFKIVLVGDSGIGKSNLILRFAEDVFTESYISTIGVDFKIRTLEVEGKTCKLQIWDTAGQERFRTITSSYYRGAHAIIVAFDITSIESFLHLDYWLDEIEKYGNALRTVVVVGTKSDAADKMIREGHGNKIVSNEAIQEFRDKHNNIEYYETSAKTSKGVNDVFVALCTCLQTLCKSSDIDPTKKNPIKQLPFFTAKEVKEPSKCCN